MIIRNVDLDLAVTPEEAAYEFCSMSSEEQVKFLNKVAEITSNWEKIFCFQLQYIMDDNNLTMAAREIMHQFGMYAYKEG